MVNQIQRLSYEYGVVQSVDTESMTAVLMTGAGRVSASIPHGGMVTVIPTVGESWTFYRNGVSIVLHGRYSYTPSGDETHLFQGDSLVDVNGTMHVNAGSVDASDQFGEFFVGVTGLMNPSRMPSTRVYAVADETDSESLDGVDVVPPCLLFVVSGDGEVVSMKWRSE